MAELDQENNMETEVNQSEVSIDNLKDFSNPILSTTKRLDRIKTSNHR